MVVKVVKDLLPSQDSIKCLTLFVIFTHIQIVEKKKTKSFYAAKIVSDCSKLIDCKYPDPLVLVARFWHFRRKLQRTREIRCSSGKAS